MNNQDLDRFDVKLIGIIFNPQKRLIMLIKRKTKDAYTFLDGPLTYKDELDVKLKTYSKEKTGYNIKNLGAVYARNCLEKENRLHLYFLCEIASGKENKAQDIEEIKWVKPSQVEKYLKEKLPPRLKEYIINLE
ncbi:MAG: NUDIX hydrolase [archaeon GW2011_AR13]|nr:MAG: NUDIX hydrolase [archaeon GW2011_AR13]HIG94736.1 hypothetical protein [Nanoarchaeota archaeon]HIH63702.1 hypothetical protein [Nanoarchaeota archaeon]HIJ09575.1 hypothetical protein [Nanoarchaeota archaeon]